MKMNNYRYEIKFSLDERSYSEAMRWLKADTHAIKKYDDRCVNSIYFDDSNYSSVRDNISGFTHRTKHRLRWYNNKESSNGETSPAFEKKIRNGRLGRKETIPLIGLKNNFLSDSLHIIESNVRLELQKANVIFDNYYTSVLAIKYLREYYEDDFGLRITFDKDIEFSHIDGLNCKLSSCPKLKYGRCIMELKFNADLKNYVSQLLSALNISPTRNSKYLIGLSMFSAAIYI
jgi:SPX domain protein involved in polyphosphate accumulation